MKEELISVLMCIYNEPIEWIEKAIQSMLEQTYKPIEIIIVNDNPSRVENIELLNSYQEKYSNIKVIFNDENIGLPNSLNKGLKHCTGKYIARMDADDISFPERIEKEYEFMLSSKYDLVGCAYSKFNENGIFEKVGALKKHEHCIQIIEYGLPVLHPTWLVKREVYEKLEGYRDFRAANDYDFLTRVVLNGYKIGNVNENLLLYRINPIGISYTKSILQHETKKWLAKNYKKNRIGDFKEFKLNQSKFAVKTKDSKLYKLREKIHLKILFIIEKITMK